MFFTHAHKSMSTMFFSAALIAASGSIATAQPVDRPAAFQTAIANSLAQAPGYSLYEASLENDSGQWKFEVQVVAANGLTMLEYEVDATSLAVLRSRNKSLSSSKISEIQTTIAAFGAATITYQQAFTLVVPRTPFGTQMDQVETGVEGGHPTYKFDFTDGTTSQRVNVDAQTGAPTGSGGGGGPTLGDITLDQAIAIAVGTYPGAKILESEFESSDHRWEIKLITAAGVARKLRIATPGGAILSDDVDLRGRERAADDRLRLGSLPSASISLAQAMQLAVAAAPGSTAIKAEWEYEHGVLVAKVTVQDAVGVRVILINASTSAIVIPTPDPTPSADPAPIVDMAGAVAFAQTASPGAAVLNVEMELKGGRQFYKVKTITLTTPLRLRELVVDGKTGVVWSSTLLPMSAAYLPTARQIVQLLPTATRTFANAQTIALAALADGQIRSIELEAEQGTFLAYNVDVLVGTKTFSLVIDSRTGAVKPK
jgi:uncharacterized membrane protein YkoI